MIMDNFYINMIGLLKERIYFGKIREDKVSALLLDLGKEIDRCRVYNEPSTELERLYDDALWLKCEISK